MARSAMQVYIAPEVSAVIALHPYLADDTFRTQPIRGQIAKQADVVKQAHAAGDTRVRMHLGSWWPAARGLSPDDLMAAQLSEADALLALSREYGYQDWAEVDALGDATTSPVFEQTLDAMLDGDLERVRSQLQSDPGLVTATSAYGHRSTLLHYLGANGVESYRQRTPLNAVELAELLIASGADLEAEANMYGGGQTAFDLASTSAHPHNAGIVDQLNRVLKPANG